MTQYGDGSHVDSDLIGGASRGSHGGAPAGVMAGGWTTFLCGAVAGAALMYFLDPDRGGRRRALLRDKMVGLSNDLGDAALGTARDLRNRAQGVVAEAGSALGMTGGGGEQEGGQENARQSAATA